MIFLLSKAKLLEIKVLWAMAALMKENMTMRMIGTKVNSIRKGKWNSCNGLTHLFKIQISLKLSGVKHRLAFSLRSSNCSNLFWDETEAI